MALNFSGRRLRAHRIERGMSIDALAAAVGRSRHTVMSWEYGRLAPRSPSLGRLSEIFDTLIDSFFEDADQQSLSGAA